MRINRILGVVLRNIFTFRRSYDRWFDAFFHPTLELVIWGLTSSYITYLSPSFAKVVFLIVSGLTLWFIVTRSQYESNVALLEDIWSKNLINLFVSPLKLSEWIAGVVIIGIIKALATLVFVSIVAFALYKVQLFSYGLTMVPFIMLLFLTGWWTGFMITAAILRFGTKVQTFAWTLIFLFAPFSGIYYPVSSLPEAAQYISKLLPTSYVFEALRQLITTGTMNQTYLLTSFLLNIFYVVLGVILLQQSYKAVLKRGMLQLM